MGFESKQWLTGETIRSSDLNRIEDGISDAVDQVGVLVERGRPSRASVSWETVAGNPCSVVRVFDALRPGVIAKSLGGGFETQGKTGALLVPPAESLRAFTARTGYNLAANADGWRVSGNVGELRGPQIINGQALHDFGDPAESPQGVDALGIRADGSYAAYSALDGDTAQGMVDDGVVTSFSYGPQCVRNGAARDLTDPLWNQFRTTPSARQILGFTGDGVLLIITVTGVSGSTGIPGVDCAALALQAGARDAWIMDGGGSAQTASGSEYVMPSSDAGCERPVPSALLVDAALPTVVSTWWPMSVSPPAAAGGSFPSFRIVGTTFEFRGEARMSDGSGVPGSVTDAVKWPFKPVNQGIATVASSGTVTGKVVAHPAGSVNLFGAGSTTPYLRLEGLRAPYLGE